MKWPTVEELNKIDMTDILSRVPDTDENKIYIDKIAGMEHYRLLVWISKNFQNASLVEVGVLKGFSGCALCSNPTNLVTGFEIAYGTNCKFPDNYTLIYGDVLQHEELIKKSSFIMYDTNHNGILEREFFNWLVKINYSGIILFDDIKLNPEMISFWEGITHKKEDISHIGHVTGTGVVWM